MTKNKFLCKAEDFRALNKSGISFPDSLALVSTDPDIPLRKLKLSISDPENARAACGCYSLWLDLHSATILRDFIATDPEGEIFLLTHEED